MLPRSDSADVSPVELFVDGLDETSLEDSMVRTATENAPKSYSVGTATENARALT
jgi:hypothetical protein